MTRPGPVCDRLRVTPAAVPSGHTYLDFNAPLSDGRARDLIATLAPLDGARVVDLGCGWAELLLRLLDTEPGARGTGVDNDPEGIERATANAADRGLADRVHLVEADVTAWSAGEPADAVINIGASHAWGDSAAALTALYPHVRPGGLLLFGDAVWDRPPTPELVADFGDLLSVAGLVDTALARGYRLISLSVAGLDEWDSFESRFCAGRERWLLAHPDAPDAAEHRARVDEHRDLWLHGYRGVLGFAYLTLARAPHAP